MEKIKEVDIKKEIRNKLIQHLYGCLAPTIIGLVLSSSTVKYWILKISPDWFTNILTIGWVQFLIIIFGGMIVPLFIFYKIELSEYNKKKTGYEILLRLISYIDDVVREKRIRFKDVKNNTLKSDSAIFRNITKPQEQISYLCSSLCLMMRYLTNDDYVKSSLIYCNNNKLDRVLAVCGEDEIKSSLQELNKKSLAKKSLDEGNCFLVEDTDKDDTFHKPKGCNAKSAIVFPIYDGARILFILCFTSSKKQVFLLPQIEKYKAIINEFEYRILLEWHLYELLRKNSDEKKKLK